ncbi:hypothetical protein ACEYYH_14395 [Microbacterium trichothecenolyticum]|uniref:hypothetical protein n=1 Tax=Microbacterium trichothecenolyticum TaxID=69370 RepID=UPI0035BE8FE8
MVGARRYGLDYSRVWGGHQEGRFMEWWEWLFDGLGTMLLGLVLGAAGGTAVTYKVMRKKTTQRQRAGDRATQIQAGRDVKGNKL